MPTYELDAIEEIANLAADEAAALAVTEGRDPDEARRLAYDRVWAEMCGGGT